MSKMKNKKSMEGGIWWLIVGGIAAIITMVVVLFILRGGLSSGKQNIEFLGSCENQGGHCEQSKQSCKSDETSFYRIGCNKDFNGDDKIDENDKLYCCIPKEKK